MAAYKVATILKQNGTLILEQLPFQVGERVEVIVMRVSKPTLKAPTTITPLHGTVLRYDAPFAPVAESDWEALQ
ncbi:MAG: hypothetical protein K8R89_09045 [Anaerolineae bacterium]|nr:hypothetical protein [Anaerolineae bacterium]